MSTAIKFENISKQYRLGLVSTRTISHDRTTFAPQTTHNQDKAAQSTPNAPWNVIICGVLTQGRYWDRSTRAKV